MFKIYIPRPLRGNCHEARAAPRQKAGQGARTVTLLGRAVAVIAVLLFATANTEMVEAASPATECRSM